MGKNTHFAGKAAEFAVASRLLDLDIPVYVPLVDTGIDLIAGESIRIQVKSATLAKGGVYIFKIGHSSKLRKDDTGYSYGIRNWPKIVDFIVFWGSDTGRFWVVPSWEFEGRLGQQCVVIGLNGIRKRINHEEILSLHASGLSGVQIAKLLGLHPNNVREHIRGETLGTNQQFDFRKYDGAWHEIESAVALAREINGTEISRSSDESQPLGAGIKNFQAQENK